MIWIIAKIKEQCLCFHMEQECTTLSLILVKSSGGIMLIDEIETAIHTSAQKYLAL
ncbi:MAG: hypothetical protein ACLTA8_00815 [Intestinibacter bartlettii]